MRNPGSQEKSLGGWSFFRAMLIVLPLTTAVDAQQPGLTWETHWYANFDNRKCVGKGYLENDARSEYQLSVVSEPPGYERPTLEIWSSAGNLTGEYLLTSKSLAESWRIPVRDSVIRGDPRIEKMLEDLLRGDAWTLEHQIAPGNVRRFISTRTGARTAAMMLEACRVSARVPAPPVPEGPFRYGRSVAFQTAKDCTLWHLFSAGPYGASISLIADVKGISVKSRTGEGQGVARIDLSAMQGPRGARNANYRLSESAGTALVQALAEGKTYSLTYAPGEPIEETLVLGGDLENKVEAAMFRACIASHASP